MSFTFSYNSYLDLLNSCKQYGEFHHFENALTVDKGFLLRHDIDFDLGLAKKLLEIELQGGVSSTNFILVSNPAYNVHARQNRDIITWMIDHDFEVGLHFDPTVYVYDSFPEIEKKYLAEKKLLEDICEKEIKSVSLHCPSIHGEFLEFKNVINAYDSRIFRDDAYLSDSRMGFRGKDPFEVIKNAKYTLMQVLFHPIHFRETASSYDEIFKDLATQKVNELDGLIRPFNNKFVEDLKNKKIIDLF